MEVMVMWEFVVGSIKEKSFPFFFAKITRHTTVFFNN